jgi:hypothetical protein
MEPPSQAAGDCASTVGFFYVADHELLLSLMAFDDGVLFVQFIFCPTRWWWVGGW